MHKPTAYLETSVLSYLAARPSRDVIVLAQQQLTADWWENQKDNYNLYVSTVVVEEASSGDTEAARKRVSLLTGVTVLAVDDESIKLAARLVEQKAIPPKAV